MRRRGSERGRAAGMLSRGVLPLCRLTLKAAVGQEILPYRTGRALLRQSIILCRCALVCRIAGAGGAEEKSVCVNGADGYSPADGIKGYGRDNIVGRIVKLMPLVRICYAARAARHRDLGYARTCGGIIVNITRVERGIGGEIIISREIIAEAEPERTLGIVCSRHSVRERTVTVYSALSVRVGYM